MDIDSKCEKRQGDYKGRVSGQLNALTQAHNHVFSEAFDLLGGVERLVSWAKEADGKGSSNMGLFYSIFGKRLPKIQHTTTEDLNRTHEQFIEMIRDMDTQSKLAQGRPAQLTVAASDKIS